MEFFIPGPHERPVLTAEGTLRMKASRSNYKKKKGNITLSLHLLMMGPLGGRHDRLVAQTTVPRSMFSYEQKKLFQTMASVVAMKLDRDFARLNKTGHLPTKEK